jgi:hypothetical protein
MANPSTCPDTTNQSMGVGHSAPLIMDSRIGVNMKAPPGHERETDPDSRTILCSLLRVLVSVSFVLLGVASNLLAGGIHVHYGPHAPEKLASSNEAFYDAVLKFDHDHPGIFAHEHPFYTKMLHDPAMIDHLVHRWESHERRFEYWSTPLWKFLDGYLLSQNGHSSTNQNPTSPPNSGPGSQPIRTQSIPEPSTAILLISGLAVGLAWRVVSRSSLRPTA